MKNESIVSSDIRVQKASWEKKKKKKNSEINNKGHWKIYFWIQENKGYIWINEDDLGEVMKANPDLSELRRQFPTKGIENK